MTKNEINIKLLKEAFSKEGLLEMLNSENKEAHGLAEIFLDTIKFPDNYWEMPDYYYKGLFSEQYRCCDDYKEMPQHLLENITSTANDRVLKACGLNKFSNHEFSSDELSIKCNKNNEEIVFSTNGNTIRIPFSILCGTLLKARELEFKKPDCLKEAGTTLSNSKNTQK